MFYIIAVLITLWAGWMMKVERKKWLIKKAGTKRGCLLFAYGTLKNEIILEELIGYIPKMEEAVLENHCVYSDRDGYYFIDYCDGGQITGKLLHINQSDFEWIDLWEEVPVYQRRQVEVKITLNGTKMAYVYYKPDFEEKNNIQEEFSQVPIEEIIEEIHALKSKKIMSLS